MKKIRRLFRALAILVLCKWLHTHWMRNHTVIVDEIMQPDRYCNLCFYWPGIDDPDDYDYFEVLK